MVEKLKRIDPHQATVLLKNAFSLPKLLFTLRSSPAYLEEELLARFDESVREALSSITNIAFNDDSWSQATLPIHLGGIGIRRAQDLALPCFISSVVSVGPLVRAVLLPVIGLAQSEGLGGAVEVWRGRAGDRAIEPMDAFRGSQKAWDLPLARVKLSLLLEQADQHSKARLLAAQHPDSGCWLSAVPVPSLGTQMDPETLRIAISLRVGAQICFPHRCKCGGFADDRGYHLLSCRFNEGRFPRHSAINDIICRALKSAGIPFVLEPAGLERGPMV